MGNTIKKTFSADTSQSEIAIDKLEAKIVSLERKMVTLTARSAASNKTFGNSWNAVKNRVDEYTKALKAATNLKDWYAATEKLQQAQREFAEINASVVQLTQSQAAAAASARGSYDMLRDAIDRTRKARDAAMKGSSEFGALDAKLKRLTEGYNRLTSATEASTKAASKQSSTFRMNSKSMEGVSLQIDVLQAKLDKMSPGKAFNKLAAVINNLKAQLRDMEKTAGSAGKSLDAAASGAVGSFARLDAELKKAVRDLKNMTAGTAAFTAQSAKVAAMRAEWTRLDAVINKAGKSQKEMSGIGGTMVGEAKSFLATYIGIHQVMQEITKEWEKQRAFQIDAGAKGTATQEALVRQAPNIGVENLSRVKKWARDSQVDLGVERQSDLVNLVGKAISGGVEDPDTAMKVVEAAVKLNAGDVELSDETIQGGVVVARLNNSDDYEAAFGQLRSSTKASQAVNENEFIGNVMGKMAALTRGRSNMDGMSTERSLEYITAASRIQVDRTGETSSTNMAAIFQRMDEFSPEHRKVLKDKSVSTIDAETIKAFKSARSFDEKLSLLQNNEELGKQFIDKQKTGGPKELAFALVQNNQAVQQIMKESKDAVKPFDESAPVYKKAVEDLQKEIPDLIARRRIAAGAEYSSTDDRTILEGSSRSAYDQIWNGTETTPAKNLSGWDTQARGEAYAQTLAMRQARKLKGLAPNEAAERAAGVKFLIEREETKTGMTGGVFRNLAMGSGTGVILAAILKMSGENKPALDDMRVKLSELNRIAALLDEQNRLMKQGAGNPAAPPSPSSVRLPSPPVPRAPVVAGAN